MKYPKSVLLILSGEFFERFTFFTLQTTLALYLVERLHFSNDMAMIIFHAFLMLNFFLPLIGAIIADSWLGKYRTILYLSIVYAFGQFLLLASSTPWLQLPAREISLLGLILIACGSGGTKPCIPSFGSDQFKLAEQKEQLPTFVKFFYLSIYISSILANFISPILRKDIPCFTLNTCYPLVFLGPLISISLVAAIYFLGKRLCVIRKPDSNVILNVSKCITYAIVHKLKSKEKRNHWLDHAISKCDHQLIEDTKAVLRIFKICALLSIYTAVYYQSHSRWTFQATHMDGEFFGYLIKPDQLHLVAPFLALIFIPICQYIIYPIIEKFFFINTPLRKITLGGILAATAFAMSGILEFRLESSYRIQPVTGLAQIRVFNAINCPVDLSVEGHMQEVEALGLYQNLNVPVTGHTSLRFYAEVKCPHSVKTEFTGSIRAEEKKALTYLLKTDSLQFGLVDKIEKSRTGDPTIRALILSESGVPASISIRGKNSYHLNSTRNKLFTEFIEVLPGFYDISIDGVQMASEVSFRSGGTYTIVAQITSDRTVLKTVIVNEPNSVHIFWQLPQYIVLMLAETLIHLTGLEFILSQAPDSMKSVVVAGWFLSSAIGNLLVVLIQNTHFFERQVFEYFLFAGLLYIDMVIFAIVAYFYKYVDLQTSGNKTIDNNANVLNTQKDAE